MKVKKLIRFLKKVKKERGNVDVVCSGFIGTNNSHVLLDLKPIENDKVSCHMNDFDELCIGVNVSKGTRESIVEDVEEMKKTGFDYYRSQYVETGKLPRKGLSLCEWHNPW